MIDMAKKPKKDASGLLLELRKYVTYEELATMIGKSFNSVYNWSKDYTRPGLGDHYLLTAMLEEYKRKDEATKPNFSTSEKVEEVKQEDSQDVV